MRIVNTHIGLYKMHNPVCVFCHILIYDKTVYAENEQFVKIS